MSPIPTLPRWFLRFGGEIKILSGSCWFVCWAWRNGGVLKRGFSLLSPKRNLSRRRAGAPAPKLFCSTSTRLSLPSAALVVRGGLPFSSLPLASTPLRGGAEECERTSSHASACVQPQPAAEHESFSIWWQSNQIPPCLLCCGAETWRPSAAALLTRCRSPPPPKHIEFTVNRWSVWARRVAFAPRKAKQGEGFSAEGWKVMKIAWIKLSGTRQHYVADVRSNAPVILTGSVLRKCVRGASESLRRGLL